MVVTEEGIVISFNLVHPSNNDSPIVVINEVNSIFFSFLQSLNKSELILILGSDSRILIISVLLFSAA